MKDPFALVPPAPKFQVNQTQPASAPPNPKKWKWTVGILAGVILLMGIGLFLVIRGGISASTPSANYQTTISVAGLPTEVKTGDSLQGTISVANKSGSEIKGSYILVNAQGIDLSDTLTLSKNLSETDSGYIRKLNADEFAYFENPLASSFYWYVGDLGADQTRSQPVRGRVTSGSEATVSLEEKYFVPRYQTVACGVLNLSRCREKTGANQIGFQATSLKLTDVAKIKLQSGYNFITLPYVFTPGSIKDFLATLKDRWAYYYRTSTAEYLDLNKDDNASYIKPGVGFWIYDTSGGEYPLPSNKVETNVNETYSMNLDIGWNQIGNPYPKRIILSGDKIMVREMAEDGTLSGAIYSLKSAIDNQVLSTPQVVSNKSFIDSNANKVELSKLIEFKTINLGAMLQTYSGIFINSTKKVTLVFPGKEIVAPGDLLTTEEKGKIEAWIVKNGLNQFGDPADTAYSGGTPLLDPTTGQLLDRYDYIISRHPDRPWLQ